ncbi:MAG: MalY/PatB family protein [Oscillospiraceae bacterium]
MNFDEYIERRGTDCCKWDDYADVFPGMDVSDTVPMWVADMDFRCPPEVVDAVVKRAQAGLYGYNVDQTEGYDNAVLGWMKKRYGWDIDREWIVFTPGVVPALSHAVQALTEPGDGVIIQPPVYYPFRRSVENNGRVVRDNSLILEEDTYGMNVDQLEELAAEPRTKLMILCSPHNPVGRVWSREELERVCTICRRHGVTLISDEIHADLLMKGVSFTSTGPVAQACGTDCISCYAPSKTFNMAGLQSSAIIIPNPEIRAKFRQQMAKSSIPSMNVFAGVALEAAWTYGEPYIKEVMEYIEANIDYAIDFAERYTPKIKFRKPQGTYLVWVDLRGLGLDTEQAERFFVERAKIAVDLGTWFGCEGAGFVRMNFACHHSTLEKALKQLHAAYEKEFA